MGEEFVGDAALLRSPPQRVGDRLHRLARAAEDEVVLAAQRLEQAGGYRLDRGALSAVVVHVVVLALVWLALRRGRAPHISGLSRLDVALDDQHQVEAAPRLIDDLNPRWIAGPQPSGGARKIADCRRKPNTPGRHRRGRRQALHQRSQMQPPRPAGVFRYDASEPIGREAAERAHRQHQEVEQAVGIRRVPGEREGQRQDLQQGTMGRGRRGAQTRQSVIDEDVVEQRRVVLGDEDDVAFAVGIGGEPTGERLESKSARQHSADGRFDADTIQTL